MNRLLVLVAVECVASACSPVLEPVVTVEQQAQALTAQASPPRVVWVLDGSGSLASSADSTIPGCACGPGTATPACPPGCETRKSLLVASLEALVSSMPPARNAAVVFPSDALCGAPVTFATQVPPAASTDSLAQVAALYAARSPLGGTPTRAALSFVASALPAEPEAETFVVLVTDGQPNCNPGNPNHQCAVVNPSCRCTTTTCTGSLCALGCLDDLGAIDASRALAQRGIGLMVVGVGPEVVGSDAAVLSSLEISLPRLCTSASDCRAGTACGPTGACEERFYAVTSRADFDRPATRLIDAVARGQRCTWWLEREVAAGDLFVLVDERPVLAGELSLTDARRVRLSGVACLQLLAGPALTPRFLWRPGTPQ